MDAAPFSTDFDSVMWHYLTERSTEHRIWLTETVKQYGCRRVLDVACGSGHDSVILVEQGLEVTSTDGSDVMINMTKTARDWKVKQSGSLPWEIHQANWITLINDLTRVQQDSSCEIEGSYDAVICLGNSFYHLGPDDHRLALTNFYRMIRPGGILIFCHRNYEQIIEHGSGPLALKDAQFTSPYMLEARCQVHQDHSGRHKCVEVDFTVDMEGIAQRCGKPLTPDSTAHLTLNGFAVMLANTSATLRSIFGPDAPYKLYGDFKLVSSDSMTPGYYRHLVQKV